MRKLRQYLTVLVGAVLTLVLSFVSDFWLSLPKEITWVIFSLGAIITITVTLLEQKLVDEISDEINDKVEIFTTLEQIHDAELYVLAKRAISDCKEKLENYRSGIIPATEWAHITDRISNCRKSYRAIFWGTKPQSLYSFEDTSAGRNYYDLNVQAVLRKVEVERVFVLDKADMLDEEGHFVDARGLRIMQSQQDAGIKVRIVWADVLKALPESANLYQDFAIIDDEEVLVQLYGAGGARLGTLIIKGNKEKVQEYRDIYQKIWRFSRPLEEIKKKYPLVHENI